MSFLIFIFLASIMASSYYGLLVFDMLRRQKLALSALVRWKRVRTLARPLRMTVMSLWASLGTLLFFSLIIFVKYY
jgi:hypothetical protein